MKNRKIRVNTCLLTSNLISKGCSALYDLFYHFRMHCPLADMEMGHRSAPSPGG
jgi:hypothetical protein